MTKEDITKRRDEYIAQREQLLAQANAVLGAIQDCNYWIEQVDKPVEVKE